VNHVVSLSPDRARGPTPARRGAGRLRHAPAGATEQAAHDAPAVPAADAAAGQVVIDNFTFGPATVTVAAGTRVTWVNHDDVPHTVTSKAKPRLFDSGALDTDGRFAFVFTALGTYDYFCAVHPHMTAKVIVR
jgi:plastocyanin